MPGVGGADDYEICAAVSPPFISRRSGRRALRGIEALQVLRKRGRENSCGPLTAVPWPLAEY